MNLIDDTIDLSAYTGRTDLSAKVRSAIDFRDDLQAAFAPRAAGQRKPEMFSTKLRNVIEFRPGEITCWAGYSGHRKSMFTGQLVLDLMTQRQRVMMASLEMKPADTLMRMARQACGGASPSPARLNHFSKWTDGRLWLFDHLGRLSPERCIAVCRYFAEDLGGTQVVLDSLMMVVSSEEHLDQQKQFSTDLVRLAQETGLHVHLIAHCRKPAQGGEERPPSKYDLRGSAAISDQAHNVVMVWLDKSKKAKLEANPGDLSLRDIPDALVTVEKQRNGRWEGRVRLWFDDSSLRFMDDRISPVQPYAMAMEGDQQ